MDGVDAVGDNLRYTVNRYNIICTEIYERVMEYLLWSKMEKGLCDQGTQLIGHLKQQMLEILCV
jgi:hypothetical protein